MVQIKNYTSPNYKNHPKWICKLYQGFFKKNVRNLVWICRDPISLFLGTPFFILGTRWSFSLILRTRFEILGTRTGSLKRLKRTLTVLKVFSPFTSFEKLALALKKQSCPEIFTVLNLLLPFSIFEQLALALKNIVTINSLYWIYFYIRDFWATCTCPENRVALKFFKPGGRPPPPNLPPSTPMHSPKH